MNKYRRWHDAIISQARRRKPIAKGENHHIVPRCLGGSNEKKNIVRLTYREHFLVHWLLTKFKIDKISKIKILYAFARMASTRRGCRITSSWQYATAARARAIAARKSIENFPERYFTKERNAKVSVALRDRVFSVDHRNNISKSKKGRSNGLEGKEFSPKHCSNISKAKTGKPITEKQLDGYKKAAKKKKGKKLTPKQRKLHLAALNEIRKRPEYHKALCLAQQRRRAREAVEART